MKIAQWSIRHCLTARLRDRPSSLVGLLLGWYRDRWVVLVDDHILDENELSRLRTATAWVDPSIQLWNRSLLENLRYGNHGNQVTPMATVIDRADLQTVLAMLPDGMQSQLGESGGFVSGGEGQRVRLGRAMVRQDARLVILDEPFRGLDRHTRQRLLTRTRELWQNATLLCITHDISETAHFDRVVVVANGQIVEADTPAVLAANEQSYYAALRQAEEQLHQQAWRNGQWRKVQLVNGQVVVTEQGHHAQ
ncbi:MAG: ATP-binding cassette domain-containing protein [Caldilineaceae bacterium]